MAFIDNTYFVGEIAIPNQTGVNSNANSISQAINQYEKEILISLLGYKLYSLLIADLNVEGKPQTQIYKDLVNGAEFDHTLGNQTTLLRWNGLVNLELQSLIAYYTYYKFVEREVTHLSGIGIISTGGDKSSRASSVNKMVNAWDRMRSLYGKIPPEYKKYSENHYHLYGSQMVGIYSPYTFDFEPSAYNFLFAKKESYPDWRFTPIWGINSFGI